MTGFFSTQESESGEKSPGREQAGIRIHGAWIRGELNLDGIASGTGLRLTACKLDQPLMLRDATLRWLVLEECVLPAVWADRATVGTLTIRNSLISGKHADGALRLANSRVISDLRLTGTRVDSPEGPAVLATGLVVDGSAFMETLDARGTGPNGAVCLTSATIGDDLVLQGARLIAGSGPAFNGEILTVKGAAWLDQGFTATGAGHSGAVCLTGARITRQLSLRGASLTNRSGPALAADLVTVRAGLMIDQGFTATGAGELAAVRLGEAKIRGYLLLDGATLANRSGPVLAADLLSVQGDMTMTGPAGSGPRFSATGAAGPCTVQLRSASVTGHLSLDGATVINYQVRDRDPESTDRTAEDGAVSLAGATIGGDLIMSGATLTSAAGPALIADQLTVKGDAFRCDRDGAHFRATGTGARGAVRLTGAHISGRLSLRGAALTCKNGPALVAGAATVRRDALLDLGFTATGAGPRATVELPEAAIGGCLSMDAGTVTSSRLTEADGDTGEYQGAVHLAGATVGGDLLLRGAMLTAFAGPALRADHLTVHGHAFRCEHRNEGFRAAGAGDRGAVSLAAAVLNGQLSLSGTIMTNDSGPALVADAVTVAGDAHLDEGFTATGGGARQAVVSLTGASIGGKLTCIGRVVSRQPGAFTLDLGRAKLGSLLLSSGFISGSGSIPSSGPGGGAADRTPLNLDGLTYASLPVLLTGNPPVRVPEASQAGEWISCFRHSAAYSAQAYHQLAAVYQAQGDEDTARGILVARGADARARSERTRFGKALQFARVISRQPPDTPRSRRVASAR